MILTQLSKYYKSSFDLFKCFIQQFESYKNYTNEMLLDIFEVDRPFEIADMFININDIVNYYESKATLEQFIDWYWEYTGQGMKPKINLKNWIRAQKKLKN
jgi:hypothetical protein